MAIEVGAFEAKNKLSQLLDQAERGQRVFITRRGKRIAMLSRAPDEDEAGSDEDLLERFRALRARTKTGNETAKDLIDEGRKR